jgi:hypothetical protein
MKESTEFTSKAISPDGSIDIGVLASILGVTEGELASSVGLSGKSVTGESGQDSNEVQRRLMVLVNLLKKRVTPWSGDPGAAYDWYCYQPIPSFGGQTAQDLVKMGRASAVKTYLDRIADGGYA